MIMSLRRRAKDDIVLFHFNGHGVPKYLDSFYVRLITMRRPTINGEFWAFNANHSQYLPISISDLLCWVGYPSIFVFDCSNAGVLVQNYRRILASDRNGTESSQWLLYLTCLARDDVINEQSQKNVFILASCSMSETLPTNPKFPADVFTACLTTPIEMALRWVFTTKQKSFLPDITEEMIEQLPGLF